MPEAEGSQGALSETLKEGKKQGNRRKKKMRKNAIGRNFE
jgi:hypothetical protein